MLFISRFNRWHAFSDTTRSVMSNQQFKCTVYGERDTVPCTAIKRIEHPQ
jgi:hypothetical protein